MEETELSFLRAYELRLLRCTLPLLNPSLGEVNHPQSSNQQTTNTLERLLSDLVSAMECGNYTLSSQAVGFVFKLDDNGSGELCDFSNKSDEWIYSELMKTAKTFLTSGSKATIDVSCRASLVMFIAIASFLAFTQCNITGPYEKLPLSLLPVNVYEGVEWESWASRELASSGSDLLGKFTNLWYIVFAKILLTTIKDFLSEGNFTSVDGIRTISWWLARVILIQQRILDERCSSLLDQLQIFTGETLKQFGELESLKTYWGLMLQKEESLNIITAIHLEAGMMELAYARVNSCKRHLDLAEKSSGLQLSVTGVLGYRTVHQVDPKAQLVLVTNKDTPNGGHIYRPASSIMQTNALDIDKDSSTKLENEISDILMTPRIVGTDESREKSRAIEQCNTESASFVEIQQAVILAKCSLIEKSSPQNEMQQWDMAPYIEAIDSKKSTSYMIRFFCDILRVRWESSRSRTKERALLMMERLVQGFYEQSPDVSQRIRLCFGVPSPTIPALRKEHAEILVSCGLIGEAVRTFEDLELWDNLIYCYCLLEKKSAAVELIKKRLEESPNDPRLWCSLGDTTISDSCYEKALEVSNNKSARAKRSLARTAYDREDYEASKILWESAMALNSLYPDGWFALGAAALKARDVDKALDGFTRAVQLDPDNGEAWNNIACLHMIKKKNKESCIAFKEALKFKRNSWQLWENYSQVSADVGNYAQALEAIQMVLDLSNYKRVDAKLLEILMDEVETRTATNKSESLIETESNVTISRQTENFVELLGKILQNIVRTGCGADIWGLYARWQRLKGDLTMCSEARLKQVRSYQGADLWKDKDRFKKFVNASLELCKVHMEIYFSTGSRRELLSAEMHLKNIIKQAGSFSDTKEFKDLEGCLEEISVIKIQFNRKTAGFSMFISLPNQGTLISVDDVSNPISNKVPVNGCSKFACIYILLVVSNPISNKVKMNLFGLP